MPSRARSPGGSRSRSSGLWWDMLGVSGTPGRTLPAPRQALLPPLPSLPALGQGGGPRRSPGRQCPAEPWLLSSGTLLCCRVERQRGGWLSPPGMGLPPRWEGCGAGRGDGGRPLLPCEHPILPKGCLGRRDGTSAKPPRSRQSPWDPKHQEVSSTGPLASQWDVAAHGHPVPSTTSRLGQSNKAALGTWNKMNWTPITPGQRRFPLGGVLLLCPWGEARVGQEAGNLPSIGR